MQLPLLVTPVAQEQFDLSITDEKMMPQDPTTGPLLQFNQENQEVLWVNWTLCTLRAQGSQVPWQAWWHIQSWLQLQIPLVLTLVLPILGFNFLGE